MDDRASFAERPTASVPLAMAFDHARPADVHHLAFVCGEHQFVDIGEVVGQHRLAMDGGCRFDEGHRHVSLVDLGQSNVGGIDLDDGSVPT